MFPNMMNPSPLYQGMFRVPALPPHHSASFLVDNLLRDRQAFQVAAAAAASGQPLGFSHLALPGITPQSNPNSLHPNSTSSPEALANNAILARIYPSSFNGPSSLLNRSVEDYKVRMSREYSTNSPTSDGEVRTPSPSQRPHSPSTSWSDGNISPSSKDIERNQTEERSTPEGVKSESKKPRLSFGVSAILSSEVSPKNCKFQILVVIN